MVAQLDNQKKALHLKRDNGRDVRTSFPARLQACVKGWRDYTKNVRQVRKRMLQHYANGYYQGTNAEAQPMNLIDRGVNIIAPFLVSKNPRVMVDAKNGVPASRSFARTMELAMEHLLREIRFAQQTMRPATFNSLFSIGIVRTGIMSSYQVELFGYLHDVGQPYADSIDFEDYVADFRARHREEMMVEGHSYILPEEFVKTSGLFKNTDRLTPTNKNKSDTRPATIVDNDFSRDDNAFEDLRATVRLVDLWIPDERIIVTIPEEGQGDHILRTVEYDGPEDGPYDILAYRYFDETILPIPPVYTWMGLNAIINRLCGKMSVQALREKKILLYDLANADDAELVANASDGERVGVRSAEAFKEAEFGGVSETNFTFMQFLEQQYSITGGNLYTIGGRESQAETLGQEQMLQANASKQLQDMVTQVHEFTRSIVHKLAWYLWSDPMIQIPVIKQIGDFKLKTQLTPDIREGDFLDYTFDIEPYSMSIHSPEVRYQRLLQLIGQIVLPTAQMAAAQGASVDANELVKEAARYLDVKNLDNWWKSVVPQEVGMNPYQPMGSSGKPSNGQADGRFGAGESSASQMADVQQHSGRTANEMHSSEAPQS